jgi:hypothetical protein
VRVLVDIEARSDGGLKAARLFTDRLDPLRHDESLLKTLETEVRERLDGDSLSDASTWVELHNTACSHVTHAVNGLLRPRWPGTKGSSTVPVELSFRLLKLNPDARDPADALPWLEVVALDEAVTKAAVGLKPGDVKANLYGSTLSLYEAGDRLRLAIRVPLEAFVTDVTLCPKNQPSAALSKFEAAAFVPRDRMSAVLDVRLKASVLWRLSAQPDGWPTAAELMVRFRGLEQTPVRVEIPCSDLGQPDNLVDVFLDIGSTTTKFIIRVADKLSSPQVKRTARLVDEWSLPPYDKAKLLADASGALWSKWVAELLPALRRYAAREHRGYLRSVHLSLPQARLLNVAGLSVGVAGREFTQSGITSSLDPLAVNALIARAATETVGVETYGRTVFLTPEHEAIACHYLAPLRVLYKTASQYHDLFTTVEDERTYQRLRRKEWDRKRAEQSKYDASGWLFKLWNARPAGPSGARPNVASAIQSPADWMQRLVAHRELLERIVLLDVGGLSLDMAVLESNLLVTECSWSDTSCGGEAVTIELAKRLGKSSLTSEEGTERKATLGDQWTKLGNNTDLSLDERFGRFGGRNQRVYREVTRSLYSAVLNGLASRLANRWRTRGSLRCTVLLTGGGSRNPHFHEMVAEKFAEVRLEPDVVDARRLQDLLVEARSFEPPHPELESAAVNLFTSVHQWAVAQTKGSEWMMYDKYAVVGGLLARALKA